MVLVQHMAFTHTSFSSQMFMIMGRGAVTRFAIYFYAMMRLVRLQSPLLATIHQAIFSDLNLNNCFRSAVMDIKDETLWKVLYTLFRYVYPAIPDLRYCNSNVPAMYFIYQLSNRTTLGIGRSCEILNDEICLDILRLAVMALNLNSLRFLALKSIMPVLLTLFPSPAAVKITLPMSKSL